MVFNLFFSHSFVAAAPTTFLQTQLQYSNLWLLHLNFQSIIYGSIFEYIPLYPFAHKIYKNKMYLTGAFRESNSGPLAPKARIIPLDQMPDAGFYHRQGHIYSEGVFYINQL
ncbi:hypothetical protein ACJIZ3_015585 [Penstemon smallii]|uniref:Uncharacterized protein n=1 Tax=Penstemon smallii TaxID=265156 RepID=A0ABD3RMV8_9LAMI